MHRSKRSLDILLFDLAWLAGLLEGEGYFGTVSNHVGGRRYRYARVGVAMTDRDVIERVARLWQASVSVVKPSGVSKKMAYRTHLFGQRAVKMMQMLKPLMGTRRQQRIAEVLHEESQRPDPNELRRMWSSNAYARREVDDQGRLRPNI